MTQGRLAVDLNGLSGFAGRLDSIRTRMNATRELVGDYDTAYGDDTVKHAVHHFESGWKDGRHKIDKDLERLATLAREAVTSIQQADSDLGDRLRESMNHEGDPGVPT